jgi:hypothetical protein
MILSWIVITLSDGMSANNHVQKTDRRHYIHVHSRISKRCSYTSYSKGDAREFEICFCITLCV